MKKFTAIFLAITIFFLALGTISFCINDLPKIRDKYYNEPIDPNETIWQYPLYDFLNDLDNRASSYINDFHDFMIDRHYKDYYDRDLFDKID